MLRRRYLVRTRQVNTQTLLNGYVSDPSVSSLWVGTLPCFQKYSNRYYINFKSREFPTMLEELISLEHY